MTDKQVLTKCIEIAIKNDWITLLAGSLCKWSVESHPENSKDIILVIDLFGNLSFKRVEEIIFDIEFAIALFGEYSEHIIVLEPGITKTYGNDGWERQLQQLAISTDRIDYLRQWQEKKDAKTT